MKRFLITTSLLLSPALALAAFNDVTLTADTNIQIGSYVLNVSGSSAAIESITINSGNFTVTLAPSSSIKVSSAALNQLSSDVASDVMSSVCNGTESSLTLSHSGVGTVTNTITPSATLCADTPTTLTPGTVSHSSSGSRVYYLTPSVAVIQPTPPNPTSNTPAIFKPTFIRNLALGFSGTDVKSLQQFLNARGFTLALSGPGSLGSETTFFGNLTRAAVLRFQKANGLPRTGFFGPLSRAVVNALP
jgi:murein L,D-transpeptidase YcbB/YkuD